MVSRKKGNWTYSTSDLFRKKRGDELRNNSNLFSKKRGNELRNNSNLFSKKRGMELQINFIVMLIIAIVVFGMGIKIAMSIFTDAKEYQTEIDEKTRNDLLSHLNSGKIISLGINRQEVDAGKSATFALGLINKYGKKIKYAVRTESVTAVDESNKAIDLSLDELNDIKEWTFEQLGPYTLEANEKEVMPLVFSVPDNAPRGLYSFVIKVHYNDSTDPDIDGFDKLFNNQAQIAYLEVN